MTTNKTCIFTNDNNINIRLIDHSATSTFITRPNNESIFRKITTYLINNKFIHGNIIDSGAWIGDNSIPWAMNCSPNIIYAIDPSPNNINFIKEMIKANNIQNLKTIEKALNNKNEILGTNDNIDHCSFKNGGRTKIESISLDYLYQEKEIDNISYIHLDVEGLEFNVIKGSEKIIEKFKPIIAFEQHTEIDNYIELSQYLNKYEYDIYLIDEISGCRTDCRNFLAFPKNIKIDIEKINNHINKKVLSKII